MPTLTTEAAARRLGISMRRMQQLLRQRRVPGAKLVGRTWQVPEDFAVTPGRRGPKRP
jgi:excisionase family DNA binding protein